MPNCFNSPAAWTRSLRPVVFLPKPVTSEPTRVDAHDRTPHLSHPLVQFPFIPSHTPSTHLARLTHPPVARVSSDASHPIPSPLILESSLRRAPLGLTQSPEVDVAGFCAGPNLGPWLNHSINRSVKSSNWSLRAESAGRRAEGG